MKTQKELKALYKEELKKTWDSERMVNFCSKNAAYIIEHGGKLYEIEKPKIETTFCFGYGSNGRSTEEDEEKAAAAEKKINTQVKTFMAENLKGIEHQQERIKEILEEMRKDWAPGSYPRYMLETGKHYTGQEESCKLYYATVVDTCKNYGIYYNGQLCFDTELLEKFIEGYEIVKADFIKRLERYLKRYGLTKLNTWSYLVD